jgi:hypothetical protein
MAGASFLAAEDEPGGFGPALHALIELDMQRDDGAPGVAEEVIHIEVREDVEKQGGAGSRRAVHRGSINKRRTRWGKLISHP